jgi:hypothetical protein
MAKIMDEATRRKLSGLLPFAPGSFARFTPPEFDGVDEEFRPVFKVREASKESLTAYRNRDTKEASATDAFVLLLQDALVGWENLRDLITGEVIAFSKDAIAALPERLITILFMRVLEYSYGPSEEEKTGLESLPPPTSEQ